MRERETERERERERISIYIYYIVKWQDYKNTLVLYEIEKKEKKTLKDDIIKMPYITILEPN